MRVKCKSCYKSVEVLHVCGCECGSFITTSNFDKMGFAQEMPKIEYMDKTGKHIQVTVNMGTGIMTVYRDYQDLYHINLNAAPGPLGEEYGCN